MDVGNAGAKLLKTAYVGAFIRRCHECILLGYARLVPTEVADSDETAITGLLVDAIEDALNDPEAPSWAIRFTAIDDRPVTVGAKTGRRRPRIDITVRRINPRPSTTFHFEANRLSDLLARFFRRSVLDSRHGYQICERRSGDAHAIAAGLA